MNCATVAQLILTSNFFFSFPVQSGNGSKGSMDIPHGHADPSSGYTFMNGQPAPKGHAPYTDMNGNPIPASTYLDMNGNPIPPSTYLDMNGNPIPPAPTYLDMKGNPIPSSGYMNMKSQRIPQHAAGAQGGGQGGSNDGSSYVAMQGTNLPRPSQPTGPYINLQGQVIFPGMHIVHSNSSTSLGSTASGQPHTYMNQPPAARPSMSQPIIARSRTIRQPSVDQSKFYH